MREIKFRAWDGKNMYRVEGFRWIGFGSPEEVKGIRVDEEGQNNRKTMQEPIITQYTGLKDKNGKEIYFDDYVKTTLHTYRIKQSKFKISLANISNGDIIDLTNKILDNLSVIGNIYEDKEDIIKKHCYI